MNLYVIGPVTGRPDRNRAAFAEARARLTAAGYNVRIPHDFIPSDASHEKAMSMSLHNILDNTDGVAMLPGWSGSAGASVEMDVALACGIPCARIECWTGSDGDSGAV